MSLCLGIVLGIEALTPVSDLDAQPRIASKFCTCTQAGMLPVATWESVAYFIGYGLTVGNSLADLMYPRWYCLDRGSIG
jgi:hypothetical protein